MWYALLSYIKQNSAVAPIGVKKRKEIQIRLIDRNKKSLMCLLSLLKRIIFPFSQIVKYICVVHFLQTGKYNNLRFNLHSVA